MANTKNPVLTESTYYILLSLYKPLHGYGIMQNVKDITNGRVNIGAGTLYGAINTLLSKGYIAEYNSSEPSKKEYIITVQGKEIVEKEIVRLKELVSNGEKITEGGTL
jgi:DNA-binding PadR family transcriptional regulator